MDLNDHANTVLIYCVSLKGTLGFFVPLTAQEIDEVDEYNFCLQERGVCGRISIVCAADPHSV